MQLYTQEHRRNAEIERIIQEQEKIIIKANNEQKQSVELFYLQNKCYNEIADITGFDWEKVRSCIQNGRRNLKLCMDKKELGVKG